MAGLSAALDLANAGVRVLVLEARGRVGGRVCTLRAPGVPLPVELGAEFVHGEAPEVTRLAREHGLALLDVDATHWERRGGRVGEDRTFENSIGRALRSATRTVRGRSDPSFADASFAQALAGAGVREPVRSRVLGYVEGFQAAHAGEISMLAVAGDDLGTQRIRRVIDGCDQLAERLRDALPAGALRLDTVVRRVAWAKSDAEVASSRADGTAPVALRAPRVVVTLPLGVLAPRPETGAADGGVRFEPALEAKSRALMHLAMGDAVRLVLRFDEAFWEDRAVVRARRDARLERMCFLHALRQPFPTWWTPWPVHAPLLTAWAGGAQADRLAGLGDEEIVARALASLGRALGIAAPGKRLPQKHGPQRHLPQRHLVEGWRHDWAADPYARGAYSHPRVGGSHAARELAAPLLGTLFFAGEATCDPPDNGTIDGAIASGRRAAREVLRSMA
jgi:monoamine oxidase